MQKDYLNFYCSKCTKNLCKEHYHNDVSCPFSTSELVKENFDNKKFSEPIFTQKFLCFFCNITTYNTKGYDCQYCKKTFCMNHRLECDHKCDKTGKVSLKDKYLDNKNKFKAKLQELKNNK